MKKDNQTGHHSRAEIGKRESSDSQPNQKVRRAEGFNDGVGSRDQKEIGKKQKGQLFFTGFDTDKLHEAKVNNKLARSQIRTNDPCSGLKVDDGGERRTAIFRHGQTVQGEDIAASD